jgi:hypothetical protein
LINSSPRKSLLLLTETLHWVLFAV